MAPESLVVFEMGALQNARCKKTLSIMGSGRNSYSTTDPDAAFMRMKEDHMRNGQLKPGYNVQIAVNSEYITGADGFHDRTDFGTLIPFMKQMKKKHGARYREAAADTGYESLNNMLFLESSGQLCFVKPANYDAQPLLKTDFAFRRFLTRGKANVRHRAILPLSA